MIFPTILALCTFGSEFVVDSDPKGRQESESSDPKSKMELTTPKYPFNGPTAEYHTETGND